MRLIKALWREPKVPGASGPQWYDWVFVAFVVLLIGLEGILRDDLNHQAFLLPFTIVSMLVMPWRRIMPLKMLMIAFGIGALSQLTSLVSEQEWTGLFSSIFLLVLPYALLRWASGRHATLGLGFIYITYAVNLVTDRPPLSEALIGNLFLLFPAALGATVRYRESAEKRSIEQIKLKEREQLARELHDTVAHHVAAIAIQAQAGKALAKTDNQAPIEALNTIELAASNTLKEMRKLVKAMRETDEANLVQATSIDDITKLASNQVYPFAINTHLEGELDNLAPTILATVYRITQESLTNVVRHAKGVTTVKLTIRGEPDFIRVIIHDNGHSASHSDPIGLGLQGMSERALLLGGSLSAGLHDQGGWCVSAKLPRLENPA